jgi:hypothetical protein
MDSNHDKETPSHVQEPRAGAEPDEFRSGDHTVPVLLNQLKGPLGTACVHPFDVGHLANSVRISYLKDVVRVGRRHGPKREWNVPIFFRVWPRLAGAKRQAAETRNSGRNNARPVLVAGESTMGRECPKCVIASNSNLDTRQAVRLCHAVRVWRKTVGLACRRCRE